MVGEYTSLAFMLPASALIGYGLGYLLDKEFETTWLYIVGLDPGNRRRLGAARPPAHAGYQQ